MTSPLPLSEDDAPIIFNLDGVLLQIHHAYLSDKPIHLLAAGNQFSHYLRSHYLLVLKKLADMDERDMIETFNGTDVWVTFRDRPAPSNW